MKLTDCKAGKLYQIIGHEYSNRTDFSLSFQDKKYGPIFQEYKECGVIKINDWFFCVDTEINNNWVFLKLIYQDKIGYLDFAYTSFDAKFLVVECF